MNSKIKEFCVLTDGTLYLCNNTKTDFWRFKFHCRWFHPVDSTPVIPKQVIGHVSQLYPNPTLAVHHITSIPFLVFQAGSQHKKINAHSLSRILRSGRAHNPQYTLHCVTTSRNPNTRSPLQTTQFHLRTINPIKCSLLHIPTLTTLIDLYKSHCFSLCNIQNSYMPSLSLSLSPHYLNNTSWSVRMAHSHIISRRLIPLWCKHYNSKTNYVLCPLNTTYILAVQNPDTWTRFGFQ
jgi:hypothetical protein